MLAIVLWAALAAVTPPPEAAALPGQLVDEILIPPARQ
jgi:hypothetical protein